MSYQIRGVSLPGVEPYPTLESLPQRFTRHDFTTSKALTLREVRKIGTLTRVRHERSRKSRVFATGGRIDHARLSPRPPQSFRLSYSSRNSPTHHSQESFHTREPSSNKTKPSTGKENGSTHSLVCKRQPDHAQDTDQGVAQQKK